MSTLSSGASPVPELPKAYDPSAIEEKWAAVWAEQRLFDVPAPPESGLGRRAFTVLLPPPNVTGRLHMGHMLNQTEIDILVRWHRMLGEAALWVPGTDHAGIATQMMVERQLKAEGGPSRADLGRDAFIDRVWQWKAQYGGAITTQMRRLGASVDWGREYFTMDADLSAAVTEAFVRLWEQGLIYRGAYIVNWDPQAETAVSDLEVETEERVGKLFHIRYPLADGSGSITIATTRPETMLGDTAVAVNPADERYKALIGKELALPLSAVDGGAARRIAIVADEWANPEFGTGAVKVTPAHDPNDFAIGQRHGLPSLAMLDTKARVNVPGSPYHGLDRYEARERMVADLQAAGLLEAVKDHPMAVPVSQRTGSVIEPRLSEQWFLAVNKQPKGGGDSIGEKAMAAVREGHIRFTPENYSKTYFEWMGNLHDWCLSRQLWWGHRIPAWYCDACGSVAVARTAPDACRQCGGTALRQETDVLDTWFSSGLLPFTVFGRPDVKTDSAAFYPTDLLVTGFDILFFWVARMVMLGTHFMLDVPRPDGSPRTLADAVPFREVYIHGLIRDANREKMSKTKGNVIDPIDIIGRFGTDAVRFTLASMASPGTDIAFSEDRTDGYRAFANKIWNAARFLFMNIERAGSGFDVHQVALLPPVADGAPLEARWIVSRLSAAAAAVNSALGAYRFDEAASHVYQFFWGDFCDWYIELAKLRLNFTEGSAADTREAHQTLGTAITVFDASLRLLSPFMPFLTEEIWHALWSKPTAESIALTRYPQPEDFPADAESLRAMETLQALITTVRALRKESGIAEKEPAPIRVYGSAETAEIAEGNAGVLSRLARVSGVEILTASPSGANLRSTPFFDVQLVYERQIDVAAERERLSRELKKLTGVLSGAEARLGNEAFLAKAPEHVVEGLRKQVEETRALADKLQASLNQLPPE